MIEVRGLVKRFGPVRALDGLDLAVRRGEVHGFLGPNGAGKSTTLRALLGLLRSDGGTASVFGLDPWRDGVAIHRRLAYVPGDVALWPNLSGGETIDLLLRMRGADPRAGRREELLERFRLDPTRRGRAYSKGNRQKVALVAALAADVDLLVLDEPTSGLDPLMEQVFAACVAERVAAGTTVLLSSHILSEVERLADRVTIIREGRTVESGSLAELRHLRRSRLSAEVSGTVPEPRCAAGGPRPRRRGHPDPLHRGAGRPARRAGHPHRRGGHRAHQHPALARGAVPRRLPPGRRAGTGRRPVNRYVGTAALVRAALRRDRVLLGVWVLVLTVVVYASAAATVDLYPSAADRVSAARALNANRAVVVLYGPILDVHSVGELAMTKLTVLYAVFVALLVLVLVRRHTRGEEEAGRAELIGATVVGRGALLAAAVLEGAGAAVLVGLLAAAADVAGGLPVTGSLAFGASWTGIGLVAAGLTALACQLSASSRTCAGVAGGALALLYALRAVGDVGPAALSWASPFGWSTRLRAWDEPRWWVLLLDLGLAAALAVAAGVLRERRDLGSGVLPARPGPREGSPRLGDVFALTWRVHRATVLTWSVSVVALGAVLGAIAPGVGDLLDSEAGRAMLESLGGAGALQDALLSAVLTIAAVVVTGFGIAVVGHGSTRRARRPDRAGARDRHLPLPRVPGRQRPGGRRRGVAARPHRAGHRGRAGQRRRRAAAGGPRAGAGGVDGARRGRAAGRRPQPLGGARLGGAGAAVPGR